MVLALAQRVCDRDDAGGWQALRRVLHPIPQRRGRESPPMRRVSCWSVSRKLRDHAGLSWVRVAAADAGESEIVGDGAPPIFC